MRTSWWHERGPTSRVRARRAPGHLHARAGMAAFLASLAVTTLLATVPAGADELISYDGSDVRKGGLDIHRATHGHRRAKLVHRINTFEPFSARDLVPTRGIMGIAFDFDNDLKIIERTLYIYSPDGRQLRSRIRDGHVGTMYPQVSRVDRKTIEVSIKRDVLLARSATDYRWFAFAATDMNRRCCFDATPWAWHDVDVPNVTITWPVPPDATPEASVPLSPSREIEFTAFDDGGWTAPSWDVHARPIEGGAWTQVAAGIVDTTRDVQRARFELPDGSSFICVRAADAAGNVGADRTRMHQPYDDAGFAYEGPGWSAWADPSAYRSTTHRTYTAGDTVTIAIPKALRMDLVVFGPEPATIAVAVNGSDMGQISIDPPPFGHRYIAPAIPGDHLTLDVNQIRIELLEGQLFLDGVFAPMPFTTMPECPRTDVASSAGSAADGAVSSASLTEQGTNLRLGEVVEVLSAFGE